MIKRKFTDIWSVTSIWLIIWMILDVCGVPIYWQFNMGLLCGYIVCTIISPLINKTESKEEIFEDMPNDANQSDPPWWK